MELLIAEKNELRAKLEKIAEVKARREIIKVRGETIDAVLACLKNRLLTYDDEVVRKLIECVVVESKDQVKIIFRGGLQVEQTLRQESIDFLSEMGQMPVNI